jgi:hypothetical protein
MSVTQVHTFIMVLLLIYGMKLVFSSTTLIPDFVKIGILVQNLERGYHAHTQNTNRERERLIHKPMRDIFLDEEKSIQNVLVLFH